MNTYVVNLVSGPGAGKSLDCALLFAELKLRGYVCEYAPEVAKQLVWQQRFDELDNQYHVSMQQYKLFKSMDGKVQFVITDGSLLHGLYYNRHNPTNVSNVDKTEEQILKWFREFNNIVLFLERGDFHYEQAGRQQTEDQAKKIDGELRNILEYRMISYTVFNSESQHVKSMADYVEKVYRAGIAVKAMDPIKTLKVMSGEETVKL